MDTTTSYLGLRLPHPFMAGASPLGLAPRHDQAARGCGLRRHRAPLAVRGADHDEQHGAHSAHGPLGAAVRRALAHVSGQPTTTRSGPDEYAEHISRVKQAVKIPVIASLNGTSAECVAEVLHASSNRQALTPWN